MLDRLRFPLDLRMSMVSPLVSDLPTAAALLEAERCQCKSCGAHAYVMCGKGRCGNCGGGELTPVRS